MSTTTKDECENVCKCEDSISEIFDKAMKLFHDVESTKEPMSSESVQLTIKAAMLNFEKVTNLVSLAQMFSSNENIEELPTGTLKYLLLPALLGTLTLKTCSQPRTEVIEVAEIYFKDYLKRCKDYGLIDIEIPGCNSDSTSEETEQPRRSQTEHEKIASLVQTRDAKIKRYKETKQLKEKLKLLTSQIDNPSVDDATKREYFTTLLLDYVNQSLEELASIKQERPILEYMAKHAGELKPPSRQGPPLKPVIITRDALQKAVFGAGYPSLPTMTVEEFYDKRVREGTFPGACNIPHATIAAAPEDSDDAEQIRRERAVECDDPEELERQRRMDEFKDDHRRGSGNRYNRS